MTPGAAETVWVEPSSKVYRTDSVPVGSESESESAPLLALLPFVRIGELGKSVEISF